MFHNLESDSSSIVGTSAPIKLRAQPPAASPPQSLMDTKVVIQSAPIERALIKDVDEEGKVEDFLKNEKQAAGLLIIGGGNTGNATSLQDSFKRFRKQKVKERKIRLLCKEELTTKGPRTREFKDDLRMKFIDQAKK